eukprot:g6992.t1
MVPQEVVALERLQLRVRSGKEADVLMRHLGAVVREWSRDLNVTQSVSVAYFDDEEQKVDSRTETVVAGARPLPAKEEEQEEELLFLPGPSAAVPVLLLRMFRAITRKCAGLCDGGPLVWPSAALYDVSYCYAGVAFAPEPQNTTSAGSPSVAQCERRWFTEKPLGEILGGGRLEEAAWSLADVLAAMIGSSTTSDLADEKAFRSVLVLSGYAGMPLGTGRVAGRGSAGAPGSAQTKDHAVLGGKLHYLELLDAAASALEQEVAGGAAADPYAVFDGVAAAESRWELVRAFRFADIQGSCVEYEKSFPPAVEERRPAVPASAGGGREVGLAEDAPPGACPPKDVGGAGKLDESTSLTPSKPSLLRRIFSGDFTALAGGGGGIGVDFGIDLDASGFSSMNRTFAFAPPCDLGWDFSGIHMLMPDVHPCEFRKTKSANELESLPHVFARSQSAPAMSTPGSSRSSSSAATGGHRRPPRPASATEPINIMPAGAAAARRRAPASVSLKVAPRLILDELQWASSAAAVAQIADELAQAREGGGSSMVNKENRVAGKEIDHSKEPLGVDAIELDDFSRNLVRHFERVVRRAPLLDAGGVLSSSGNGNAGRRVLREVPDLLLSIGEHHSESFSSAPPPSSTSFLASRRKFQTSGGRPGGQIFTGSPSSLNILDIQPGVYQKDLSRIGAPCGFAPSIGNVLASTASLARLMLHTFSPPAEDSATARASGSPSLLSANQFELVRDALSRKKREEPLFSSGSGRGREDQSWRKSQSPFLNFNAALAYGQLNYDSPEPGLSVPQRSQTPGPAKTTRFTFKVVVNDEDYHHNPSASAAVGEPHEKVITVDVGSTFSASASGRAEDGGWSPFAHDSNLFSLSGSNPLGGSCHHNTFSAALNLGLSLCENSAGNVGPYDWTKKQAEHCPGAAKQFYMRKLHYEMLKALVKLHVAGSAGKVDSGTVAMVGDDESWLLEEANYRQGFERFCSSKKMSVVS